MEKANIQYKSVNFMRGRSIQNAIVIVYLGVGELKKVSHPLFHWPVSPVTKNNSITQQKNSGGTQNEPNVSPLGGVKKYLQDAHIVTNSMFVEAA
jgi:hypothetical protein